MDIQKTMTIIEQPFPGTFLIKPKVVADIRGDFVKTFHEPLFAELGIQFKPVEEFFSTSHKDVLRGMHFQLPPHDYDKLVYCIRGRVLDVLLDLRKSSPFFRRCASAELSGASHHQFFIPKGVAHGFLSLDDDSVMVYKTSAVHAPEHDAGIRWDSLEFQWPLANPVLSARDQNSQVLKQFNSPFP
jgi:dTDP-4-dehydrorhamnose 3,5-epimerase/CDP-3, 6-dideoxy-D-glycero-D-glycero-4-hexulose-5-epimerase